MQIKDIISNLGFNPKEGTSGIFEKKYPTCDNYAIEVDIQNECIIYGDKIICENKTTQNFSQSENFVVLECVNRLLEKGYKPQNIILEKTWGAGHGTSGRLDICVTRDDGSEYLLIECKTFGKEFDKEFSRMSKDGGQLFTYFKFSNKADVLMLYASELKGKKIIYKNEIVKIEDDYRSGDVKDFYDKWNKLTKDNGVFDTWVKPYFFESKALTINELEDIKQEDSSFIFNRFLEILRHNVVSDKPNAFNKIFTLFLCKIYDEKNNEGTNNELGFQWIEGVDDDISFQLRLTDLYKEGMWEFLEKRVTDFSEDEFEQKYKSLEDSARKELLKDFKKIRLEKNNEFAIKEVYDEKSFKENAKVVKQVVELLQKYKIRYAKKQQYLSDFFELLLTTGLKQESGQFFTPVPIAQFIIKSLPIDSFVSTKLKEGKRDELLPYVIDYAAGSGHFITESMHEIQRLLNNFDLAEIRGDAKKFVETARISHFDWALRYIYGIEKDYRLVKVGKVGCYLHGDGLANVIHSDGLANFAHSDYKGKLKKNDKDFRQENKQFDIVVSNPPYSVSAFKNAAREYYKDEDFDLYSRLTDNSSEIECLFIERTKQLLKDGGVAGIILPSSILSNAGIYTKAREVILQYFEIIGITELGSNTFMATGTNTVVLFLRRRNNYESINTKKSVDTFFTSFNDVTINNIESPASKYISYVWENLPFTDYISLAKRTPSKAVEEHEIYKEYRKKIKAKDEAVFWNTVIDIEKEKLYYFILTYSQKVVLVKSGEKDDEKRFLGYEFSNRRGNEGIHPIQRGKTIDECTRLFDAEVFDNPNKASTYIYKAYNGNFEFEIDESLKNNISRVNLVDMLTFDRVDFEKSISTAIKKKVEIESRWKLVKISELSESITAGGDLPKDRFSKERTDQFSIPIYSNGIDADGLYGYTDEARVYNNCVTVSARGTIGFSKERKRPFVPIVRLLVIVPKAEQAISKYLEVVLNTIKFEQYASATPQLTVPQISDYKIPLPPKDIQEKIIAEIEKIEEKENKAKQKKIELRNNIEQLILDIYDKDYVKKRIGDVLVVNPPKTELKDIDDATMISFVEMASVSNKGYIETKVDKILKDVRKGSYTYFKENDIIIAKITPCMENGKCALATGLRNGIAMGSSEFHVFRTNEEVDPKYIFSLLNRKTIRQEAEINMTGASGHRRVPINFYKNINIPIPSIAEQKKIVEEIEILEKQITKSQETIDSSPELKNAILRKYL
ncbi:restriction endonuclease [Bacteroidia bacterium]|nr:restriction endonuclease [Bacteroidia bacterium]